MPVPLTPLRCLERARDLFGKYEGVIDGAQRFSYEEFAERTQRLAGALRAAGLKRGEPAAFLSRNGHVLLEGYFGVPLAGGLITPLNIRLAEPELAAIISDSGARFLIYEKEFSTLARRLAVPLSFEIGPEYEAWLAQAEPEPISIQNIDENGPASLFYTSGTTGTPKGVIHSHRALYLHALSVALTFHLDDTTVELYTVPLFHANGWGRPHAGVLMGAKHVLLPRFDPAEIYRLIEAERVTSMGLVPTMAEKLLQYTSRHVSSMREIHLGGSPVSKDLIERLQERFHCLCTAGYGMTETGPVATTGRPKRETSAKLHDAGWPVVGAYARVDEAGEVLLGGDHLMTGYWGDAPAGGTIPTGDLASTDENGFLVITGRKKDIIISGGENVSASEIEHAIEAHPAVRECAVVPFPDEQWGEVALAYVVRNSDLSEQELRTWLEARIARFKIPKHWRFMPGPLPRTATGKLAKFALQVDPSAGL